MVAPTHIRDTLTHGIYTPMEAATYAKIPIQTLTRWLYGNRMGERVLDPEYEQIQQRLVSFLDFVQALAVRTIREKHKLPLHKMRKAVLQAKQAFNIDYPFARRHSTYLFGRDLFIIPPGKEDILYQLTGRHVGQLANMKIVEEYISDLTFEDETGLASEYCAYQRGRWKITMNPQRRFGEPVVKSCGITARTLCDAYEAEGGSRPAAEAFDVRPEEVEVAYRYYQWLSRKDIK